MAEVNSSALPPAISGGNASVTEQSTALPLPTVLTTSPLVRQLALMVGLAVSVAIAVAVVLWFQQPSYRVLLPSLAEEEMLEVVQALQQAGIVHKLDDASGALLVPGADFRAAKMQLAAGGLPERKALGFDALNKESGFGVSQFMLRARHQRATEQELAMSIVSINAVRSARIHLALPKQSVFIRDRQQPSASVIVNLYSGRKLAANQVDAIVHLVSSGIPNLSPDRVTVVDQNGRKLTNDEEKKFGMSDRQLEYTQRLEKKLVDRIYFILSPFVGKNGVRAEVNVDVDFTQVEQAEERYEPGSSVLRSEQLVEERSGRSRPMGVPGALTNQPPAAGTAPEVAAGVAGKANSASEQSNKRSVRNFELDKVVRHSKRSAGVLQRLSVAVVVDNKNRRSEDGKVTSVRWTNEELVRMSGLIKESVGYSQSRGDSVQLINAGFVVEPEAEEVPVEAVPIWQEFWFIELVKQAGAILFVLLMLFIVVRPAMKALMKPKVLIQEAPETEAVIGETVTVDGKEVPIAQLTEAQRAALQQETGMSEEEIEQLGGPKSYASQLKSTQQAMEDEPEVAAAMIRRWMEG